MSFEDGSYSAMNDGGQGEIKVASSEFEAELNHIRNEVDYILDDDTAGVVRITYANGHSEIKDAKVLLADDIMRVVEGSMKRAAQQARIDELGWHRKLARERYYYGGEQTTDAATTVRVIDDRLKELKGVSNDRS